MATLLPGFVYLCYTLYKHLGLLAFEQQNLLNI